MKEFFSTLEPILFASNPDIKITSFEAFYDDFLSGNTYFESIAPIKLQTSPSYALNCTIIHPTQISRPKSLSSPQSLAKCIHSIAHIEYSAIDLALDAAYRFRDLPLAYYQDWLCVASEEIKHFRLLREILTELGFAYGSFAVHSNLFEAMVLTSSSFAERMGLVHRGIEAMGLDANPFVIQKLHTSTHPIKLQAINALEIIFNDEITHVQKGNRWWQYSQPSEYAFFELIKKFSAFTLKGKVLNTSARLQAGFSQKEILKLQDFKQR
ncbi:hypothetical protein BKH46_00990 [Helicobacter sp. 12S02634-8]|uniref:ferritin-like domain-containing protein n=1 Tax=Helicobacter sp. 12S02634-8 TaxID=1476199 RepID=UPI000BA6EFB8|nr:ferritin-like domain-containing protein [Helicobacter sp. 12S02634-8]PAF48512.1 hypothetical protein BKH46_00990 [Helicobacter sp. 12S02634-8]